jgi:hypothetical protein
MRDDKRAAFLLCLDLLLDLPGFGPAVPLLLWLPQPSCWLVC